MNPDSSFAAFNSHLRAFIERVHSAPLSNHAQETEFNNLAMALFSLQFDALPLLRNVCFARGISPKSLEHWTQIPAIPTAAFKEFEVSSLAPAERARVFHSSGTTRQIPSRHYHSLESLAVYEASLLPWFNEHVRLLTSAATGDLLILTPSPALAPNSSLVHMFEVVRREFQSSLFVGRTDAEGWTLDMDAATASLHHSASTHQPIAVVGTAFSFVHLLDYCRANHLQWKLPSGSRVLETGGYKGRSRALSRSELHKLITKYLGIPASHIISEYGMSELSSQAYDRHVGETNERIFHFPPWARARIISPETGAPVNEGEIGLVRILDLANVRSVMAIQTEDLAIRRQSGFELLGRAAQAEPRGCSLMTA